MHGFSSRSIVTGTRLTILCDGGPEDLGPDTRLLGLSFVKRAVLAGKKAGFADIRVLTPDPSPVATVFSEPGVGLSTAPNAQAERLPEVVIGWWMIAEPGRLKRLAGIAATAKRAAGADGILVFPREHEGPEGSRIEDWYPEVDPEPLPEAAQLFAATGKNDLRRAERWLLSHLVKETDGFMARHFARPISLAVSRRLAKTETTPNQMTFYCMVIGLAAAPFFLFSTWWLQTIGATLFIVHSVIDGVDGELARLKFRESRFGGLFDFWSDNLVHVAVFACMAVGWHLAVGDIWPLYVGAAAVTGAGGSAIAVYWLTLRRKSGDGPVYTSVASSENGALTRVLDELSRRDFIYLIFVLALFGKASWFLALTAVGAPVFLLLVLVLAVRGAMRSSPQETA